MGRIHVDQLESVTSGSFIVGNAIGNAAIVAPSGDVTFDNAGIFAISAGAVVDADVNAAAAIAESKLSFDATTGHDHNGTNSKAVSGVTEVWDEVPTGTIDNSNTLYTLATVPETQKLMVFLNGIKLERVATALDRDEFEHVSGSTIFTMGDAPNGDDIVHCHYQI